MNGSPSSASSAVALATFDTTRAMPMPQLNTRSISSGATCPACASQGNTGGIVQALPSSTAVTPAGSTRGRLPGRPPPVMWAAPFSRPARCSASTGDT